MHIAAFNATCPFEIGDKVYVIGSRMALAPPETDPNQQKIITDIACTHYLRNGKIEFSYEFNGNGEYHKNMLFPSRKEVTT